MPAPAPCLGSSTGSSWRGASPGSSVSLTAREREVFALLCQHWTDAEIADRLFVSTRTVEHHVSNILGKVGAANRREAAAITARLDLHDSPAK